MVRAQVTNNENDVSRVVLVWKPSEKHPCERPSKRWLDTDDVLKDHSRMNVQEWRELAKDRGKWMVLMMIVKTYKEY